MAVFINLMVCCLTIDEKLPVIFEELFSPYFAVTKLLVLRLCDETKCRFFKASSKEQGALATCLCATAVVPYYSILDLLRNSVIKS